MSRRSVYYGSFGGMDVNAKNASFASDCMNFAIDESGSVMKSRGLLLYKTAPADIDAVWAGTLGGRKAIVYLSGGYLYDLDPDTDVTSATSVSAAARAAFFKFEGALYALCDTGYFRYDGTNLVSVDGYVPLISVSTSPSGAGTAYEAVNMLTSLRRQLFSPDGAEDCFHLAEKNIDHVESVVFDGETVEPENYTVDTANGTVTLTGAPYESVNTLEITYGMPSSGRSEFLKYQNAMLFGSDADARVFLWHNADKPCFRIHSELADGVPSAEYFPVNAYTSVGSSPITDIVQEYGKQLIFASDAAYYSYCEMKTGVSGKAYASFPVYPLHPSKGNLIYGSGVAANGFPVTLCSDGLNIWQPTNVETEKNAHCVSSPVKPYLIPETHGLAANAKIFDLASESELYVVCTSCLLVYNYVSKRWYRLENDGISNIFECFGTVYATAGKKIYKMLYSVRTHASRYKTHYSELGSAALKDILFVNLTLEAGSVTAGSVAVYWPGDGKTHKVEKEFSVAAAQSGNAVTVAVPFFIPSVSGVALEFKCPAAKELKILGYGITFEEKGGNDGL